jgi:predicted nucleotide-binding protein (sugar kinase/HSP70/actin superfamily)
VAIQAVPILRKALDKAGFKDVKINLITLSAPADNAEGSVENPSTYAKLINKHIQLYNDLDVVQESYANRIDPLEDFEKTYNERKTHNIKLNVDKYYKKIEIKNGKTKTSVDGTGAHSVDYEHPEVLKEGIDNGTIPTIKKS